MITFYYSSVAKKHVATYAFSDLSAVYINLIHVQRGQ